MKRLLVLALCLILGTSVISAQEYREFSGYRFRTEVLPDGDTIMVVAIPPAYVFRKKADVRKYNRLVESIKIVYPIAREANATLQEMEAKIAAMNSDKQIDAYTKEMEKFLKKKYTPVIKQLTFSQGKILIKLIDRETSRTAHALLKELRGGFSTFIWQGVARIFGANLKDTYDKDGEDWIIEQLIILYEQGML